MKRTQYVGDAKQMAKSKGGMTASVPNRAMTPQSGNKSQGGPAKSAKKPPAKLVKKGKR